MMNDMSRRRIIPAALLLAAAVLVPACDGSTEPLRPGRLSGTSPVQQAGIAGETVAAPPTVRVTTSSGQPVPDVAVTFQVTAGGGTVTGAAVRTNADGVAALAEWRLGTVAGENAVTAQAAGLQDATITFRAAGTAGPPTQLVLTTQPPASVTRGTALFPAPVVQLVDQHGNASAVSGVVVTATAEPAVELQNATAVTTMSGMATFTGLAFLEAPGSHTLGFSAPGLLPAAGAFATAVVDEAAGSCAPVHDLDFALGQVVRVRMSSPAGFNCLGFDLARNGGQQYLLLLENMPLTGPYRHALFPGGTSDASFSYTLHAVPRAVPGTPLIATALQPLLVQPAPPPRTTHSWDFGAGRIYEIEPLPPPGGAPPPLLLQADGQMVDMNTTTPAPGDTVQVWMEGIPRLEIPTGNQRAVIRYISDELIIAEDVRLATLPREEGGFNSPLHPDTMRAMAEQYAAMARVQGDLLFEGRHNAATESQNGGRILAIHSVMYDYDIWGYTYVTANYFVWDYWVGATHGTNGTLNQRVERNVDNIFMHEIAHMRHVGLLQRAGVPTSLLGNRWLVEGFARFTERLPIAARLLGTHEPSRTSNIVLPRNPAFSNSYFRDDVPTFLNTSTSMLGGYNHSSYVFDYLADQVALQGGDWRAAVREFVIAAGREQTLDAAVDRWLPGLTFGDLFSRSRKALYLDDIGTAGLPAWTQYHQFRLRESRPAGILEAQDPRNAWTRLAPGVAYQVSGSLAAGTAWGFIIDGTSASSDALFNIIGPSTGNAVLSLTRIR
jgi:hypothetical protein